MLYKAGLELSESNEVSVKIWILIRIEKIVVVVHFTNKHK